jgi:hypothetical protein
MKIIKLNQRFVLGREGFTHGLEFASRESVLLSQVERKLQEMLGWGWGRYSWQHSSCHKWGSYRNHKNFRTYVGVRDEAILTALMLSIE